MLTAGCAPKGNGDASPMDDSVFVDLLIDLHIASARGQRWNDLGTGAQDSVLRQYGMTPADYERAAAYYAAHPAAYLDRYNEALDRLNVERFSP